MIKLDIKDHCHTCAYFDPELSEINGTYFYDDVAYGEIGDNVITCSRSIMCEYLRRKAKKEKDSE